MAQDDKGGVAVGADGSVKPGEAGNRVAQANVTSAEAQAKEQADAERERKQREEEAAKRKKEEEEKSKEQKQQDKSRPISSTPVPGTPW